MNRLSKLSRSRADGSASTGMSRLPQLPKAKPQPEGTAAQPPRLLFAAGWRLGTRVNKRDFAALLVALAIALLLTPHVLNFARRDDFERDIVPLAVGWQVLESAEGRLLDQRFVSRGPIVPQSTRDIAIVAIDQSSLEGMGEWPFPRAWHARLIRRLKKAGARVIVFDVNFSSKQNALANGELSSGDTALVEASADAGNVLISTGFHTQFKATGRGGRGRVNSTTPPFDELDETTVDVGFNWMPGDSFNQVRRYAWRAQTAASLPSLSVLAVGMFQGKLDGDENKGFYQVLERGEWPDARGKTHRVPLSEMRVGRDDRAWVMPIFYWGPSGTFPTYSFQDVLTSRDKAWSDAGLKQKFAGRIVFVGATADILKDTFSAPAFQSDEEIISAEASAAQIYGVEIHAGVAAQALDGRYLHPQSTRGALACLFALCLGGAGWMSLLREPVSRAARRAQGGWSRLKAPGRIHSPVWFALYVGLGALPIFVFWGWSQWEFAQRDRWIVAVYPLLGGILSASSALLLFFVAESGERRKMWARFSRRASPDVLEEMMAHPEEVDLTPHRAHVSVLFSDLEGFTTYSDVHSAAEVAEALNDYMTRMVAVVHAHNGTVDKFIGDAVMAFFGAPAPHFDHAGLALSCAVAMQEECARFRRESGIDFYMRVGVHSGEAIVGEMGARERNEYTVIGSTVNLASRLEGKNKDVDSRILCSDDTFALAGEIVEAEPARVAIKGLSHEVDVWMVRGLKGLPPAESWEPIETRAGEPDALEDGAPQQLDSGSAPPAALALVEPEEEAPTQQASTSKASGA
jgi:adenylate cyclase